MKRWSWTSTAKMILIKKSPVSHELDTLKRKAEKQGLSEKQAYDKLKNPLKAQVREALMRERGHLCAYCMRKIPESRYGG